VGGGANVWTPTALGVAGATTAVDRVLLDTAIDDCQLTIQSQQPQQPALLAIDHNC